MVYCDISGEDTQEASQLSEEGTTGERGELVTDVSPISQSPRVTEPHKVEDGMKYHPEYEAMLKSPSTDDARAVSTRCFEALFFF